MGGESTVEGENLVGGDRGGGWAEKYMIEGEGMPGREGTVGREKYGGREGIVGGKYLLPYTRRNSRLDRSRDCILYYYLLREK